MPTVVRARTQSLLISHGLQMLMKGVAATQSLVGMNVPTLLCNQTTKHNSKHYKVVTVLPLENAAAHGLLYICRSLNFEQIHKSISILV